MRKMTQILSENKGSMQLSESFALRTVSVLLALILWITILSLKAEEKVIRVPFQPLLPPGMRIINDVPTHFEFTLSGPRIWVKEAEKRIQPYQPDWRRTRESTLGFPVTPELIGELPVGVVVVHVSPPQILVRLDEVGERYILVRPTFRGTPVAGHELSGVKVFPSKVAVMGPLTVLDSLEAVGTEPFNLDGLQGSREGTVAVEVDESKGLKVSRENTVRVRVYTRKVDVSERAEERK